MKLMTKEIEAALPPLYTHGNTPDPVVRAKFFTPWTNWTWYAIEYDPEQKLFFGYVKGLESELGYFGLDELEEVNGPHGLKIERDLHFQPVPLSQIRD